MVHLGHGNFVGMGFGVLVFLCLLMNNASAPCIGEACLPLCFFSTLW
jgi:hypothetical protein